MSHYCSPRNRTIPMEQKDCSMCAPPVSQPETPAPTEAESLRQQKTAAVKGASARGAGLSIDSQHGYADANARAWKWGWEYANDFIRGVPAPAPSEEARPDRVSIEIYQQDWMPGFAAFLAPAEGGMEINEMDDSAKAHVILNVGSLLSAVQTGHLDKRDLPYMIAESLMHEVIHVLEAWAGVEFNEERAEALLEKYRERYGQPTHANNTSTDLDDPETWRGIADTYDKSPAPAPSEEATRRFARWHSGSCPRLLWPHTQDCECGLDAAITEATRQLTAKLDTKSWRCFGCDFVTSNPKEAEAHFGDGDEGSEFVPICKWWAKSDEAEKRQAYQDLLIELAGARDREGEQFSRVEQLQAKLDEELRMDAQLQEMVAKYIADIERLQADNVALREKLK